MKQLTVVAVLLLIILATITAQNNFVFGQNTTDLTSGTTMSTMASTVETNTTAPSNTMESNTTMMPTNASATTMMPMPPPPPACSNLTYHVDCYLNTACQDYNMTCAPKCDTQNNDANMCNSWPHCWHTTASGSGHCLTHCDTIMAKDACFGTTSCHWYNGKCGNDCPELNGDADKCGMNTACKWNPNSMKCYYPCDNAKDAITCNLIFTDCLWDMGMKKCVSNCADLHMSECTLHEHCQLFVVGTSEYCLDKCSRHTMRKDCDNHVQCLWDNGMCTQTCWALNTNPTKCNSLAACSYDSKAGVCKLDNCSALSGQACGVVDTDQCQFGNANTCVSACGRSVASSNSTCPMNVCNWTQANGCKDTPCSATNDENTCALRNDCTWVDRTCKKACATATNNKTQCDMWAHCWWAAPNQCNPRCGEPTSKIACEGANGDRPWNGPCYWASNSLGCRNDCGAFRQNQAQCAQQSHCQAIQRPGYQMCIAKCDSAMDMMTCNNGFFSSTWGCFWNNMSSKCETACEFRDVCDGPCMMSANFSLCVMAPPPPPTMAPNSTMATTMMSTMTNTTAAPTTAAGSTSDAPTTTMMATTTGAATQAASTAAPVKRNPRVEFVLTSIAKARSNTTAANFKEQLRVMLGIPANAFQVTYDEGKGAMIVEFVEDFKTNTGTEINATAEFEKAKSLDQTQLDSLGAASVTSIEPAPAPAAPGDDGPDVAVIAGAAAGGFIFLLIILFIIKKQSSGGTGAYLEDDKPGDRPMLEVPQQQQGAPRL